MTDVKTMLKGQSLAALDKVYELLHRAEVKQDNKENQQAKLGPLQHPPGAFAESIPGYVPQRRRRRYYEERLCRAEYMAVLSSVERLHS